MKILMLSHYYAPHLGGVEKHLAKLNQELLKDGHQVTVLTSQHTDDLPLEDKIDGVEVKRLPIKQIKFFGLFHLWWQLIKRVSFFKQFDLIHIHDVFIWFLPIRLVLPFKPVFMTFHGYQSSPVKLKERIFKKLGAKLTLANIAVGDFIPAHFGIDSDLISYGGVDRQHYLSLAKEEIKQKNIYQALFVGRFAEDIGFQIYLDAIKILQTKQDFKVLFLGDGAFRQDAEKVGQCLGWVKGVAPYYFQTQIVFASSYLSILEAMAAQKLVFAVYDSHDQVKEDYLKLAPFSQWLVIVNNPESLVQQVEYYQIHPEEAAKKIKAAHQWVQNQTWSKLAKNYQQLWQKKL